MSSEYGIYVSSAFEIREIITLGSVTDQLRTKVVKLAVEDITGMLQNQARVAPDAGGYQR
jgi:hypothetical protein